MEEKLYQFIVDRAGRASPQHSPGSQPIVCINRELFNDLPDGTVLYDHSGGIHRKGHDAMGAWHAANPYGSPEAYHPSLAFTVFGIANFGFLATDDDLQHPAAFMGPYRDS